jgi:hypothetical protein
MISSIGKIPIHFAMIKDLNGLVVQNRPDKQKQSHIGSSPGAIDREKPQPRAVHVVQVAVSVRHQLVGFFRGGIKRYRMVHVVMHRKRHQRVCPIYGTGRGEHEMLHLIVPAAFQKIYKSDNIGIHVRMGVGQGIPDACLGCQVHHHVKGQVFLENGFQLGPIRKIILMKRKLVK